MRVETAYERFHRATVQIRAERSEQGWSAPPARSRACSICGRPWDQVEDPTQCGVYQYVDGLAREYECTTCHTVRVSAPDYLGIEMYRGKNKVPSGARLGMLPGCGGVITANDELFLALNRGFHTKLVGHALGRTGAIHQTTGLALLLELLATKRLGDIANGFVFVSVWGRKPDVLMGSLALTRSLSEVWCCSETGAECLDLDALIRTAKWLHGHGFASKATKPTFWKPVRLAAMGQHDAGALAKWAKGVPEPQELLNTLPIDPHTRIRLPSLMEDVMPWVIGGDL